MPTPGDVDVVVCSELMEAGRAIQRGIVTPDRTVLVTSTHRVYSMTERVALADGRVDAAALVEGARAAAKRLVAFDMAALAERTGSVISAVMFGALARSAALPFGRAAFEATIERGGVGVAASLRAFRAAFEVNDLDGAPLPPEAKPAPPVAATVPGLVEEADAWVPEPARAVVRAGIERTADYQDAAYARLYLDRLRPVLEVERSHGDGGWRLLTETARHLALGMTFEDTIRVAQLKIRESRFERVRGEVRAGDGQVLRIAEFLHPRLQEVAETLPAPLGRLVLRQPLRGLVSRLTSEGRIVETTSIRGFLLLYAAASLKPWRRTSLRWAEEQAHLEDWLARVVATARRDYALALELAECRNLVKGYGDTHARGKASYQRILGQVDALAAKPQPARALADLRAAALADDTGAKLEEAIRRMAA
jgi:indolepyruvate ferredoxin oxidoreductase beta subunit